MHLNLEPVFMMFPGERSSEIIFPWGGWPKRPWDPQLHWGWARTHSEPFRSEILGFVPYKYFWHLNEHHKEENQSESRKKQTNKKLRQEIKGPGRHVGEQRKKSLSRRDYLGLKGPESIAQAWITEEFALLVLAAFIPFHLSKQANYWPGNKLAQEPKLEQTHSWQRSFSPQELMINPAEWERGLHSMQK